MQDELIRMFKILPDGTVETMKINPVDFDLSITCETGGPARIIIGDPDILVDGNILVCDREEFTGLEPNPVASYLNIYGYGRNIYGTAIVAKLGKTVNGYGVCDFEDQEYAAVTKILKDTVAMIYG